MNDIEDAFVGTWLQSGVGVALRELFTGIPARYDTNLLEVSACRGMDSIYMTPELPHLDRLQCQGVAGELIMLDLLANLSTKAFRDGIRATYAYALQNSLRGYSRCAPGLGGICQMWQGFVTQATPANAAIAAPIINKWYFGSEQGYGQG